jgi:hypothetical protein
LVEGISKVTLIIQFVKKYVKISKIGTMAGSFSQPALLAKGVSIRILLLG